MRLVEGRAEIEDVDAFVDQLAEIGRAHDAIVQAFDARYVAGRRHLEAAVRMASRAIDNEDTIADNPALEVLLYAAGRRQIDRALTLGVDTGERPVVVVVKGGVEAVVVDAVETLLTLESTLDRARDEAAIREFYEISKTELDATDASLEDLVIERVALLAVEK